MGRFLILALLTVPAVLLAGSAQSQTPALPACRATTEVENTALARTWHDDVSIDAIRRSSGTFLLPRSRITQPAAIPG
jgi:hypothetical protein